MLTFHVMLEVPGLLQCRRSGHTCSARDMTCRLAEYRQVKSFVRAMEVASSPLVAACSGRVGDLPHRTSLESVSCMQAGAAALQSASALQCRLHPASMR